MLPIRRTKLFGKYIAHFSGRVAFLALLTLTTNAKWAGKELKQPKVWPAKMPRACKNLIVHAAVGRVTSHSVAWHKHMIDTKCVQQRYVGKRHEVSAKSQNPRILLPRATLVSLTGIVADTNRMPLSQHAKVTMSVCPS